MKTYRIPKRYYIDHVECDCEAPEILEETKTHYIISAEETPELLELRSRALFYVSEGPYMNGCAGIVASAKATIKVIGDDMSQSQNPEHGLRDMVSGYREGLR
jgi:hypothetical protein